MVSLGLQAMASLFASPSMGCQATLQCLVGSHTLALCVISQAIQAAWLHPVLEEGWEVFSVMRGGVAITVQ